MLNSEDQTADAREPEKGVLKTDGSASWKEEQKQRLLAQPQISNNMRF